MPRSIWATVPPREFAGPRGFQYDEFGPAKVTAMYSRRVPVPDVPDHFFTDRPDGRDDLPPMEVIVHPCEKVLAPVVERIEIPPRPIITRPAPMNVEIEYREHIHFPDGHWEHSIPTFDYVDRDSWLATHPL